MKFYIASSLGNAEAVKKIASYLVSRGWEQTYDWTEHGPVKNLEDLEMVSTGELQGVTGCDVFFLLLPGRRGSHAELGAALASRKPVIILSPEQDFFYEGGLTCSFYHHPGVQSRIIDRDWFALACLAFKEGRKIKLRRNNKNIECPECGSEDVYTESNIIHCLACSTHSTK